jgi:hypothetical protein
MLFSSDLLQANHVILVVEATAIREPHGTLVVFTKYDIPLMIEFRALLRVATRLDFTCTEMKLSPVMQTNETGLIRTLVTLNKERTALLIFKHVICDLLNTVIVTKVEGNVF